MRNANEVLGWFGAITLLFAAIAPPVTAQAMTDTGLAPSRPGGTARVVRFGLGVGAGSMGSGESAIAARTGLTIGAGDHGAITVRSAVAEEFVLWGPTPAENVWDVGVLYGRQARGKWGYASASAGVAVVGGVRRGQRISEPYECSGSPFCWLGGLFSTVEYEALQFHTVGIPVELEAGFTFLPVLGLNLSAWANFNGERTMTGASVGLVIGKLR